MEMTEPYASLIIAILKFSVDQGSVMSIWTGSLPMEPKLELKIGTLTKK